MQKAFLIFEFNMQSCAMFEKFGDDGYKMHVYPTHRGTIRPDWYYANSIKNATGATLIEDGQKIDGNLPGVPFPIPQSGLEAIWNHMVRYAEDTTSTGDVYYVGANGKPILSTTGSSVSIFPMFKNPDEANSSTWVVMSSTVKSYSPKALGKPAFG